MPYVNIRITDEEVTLEQKQALIKGVTQLLQTVLDKNPKTTHVIIDETSTDNWRLADKTVTELRNDAKSN
ncbi:MAG: 4-oxalocrotonate tautomerase family protein [Pseudomonadota bacterium]|nr:4-oxalocrotonate tautomerase family protein [Pseudomonadota bacterium]